MCKSAQKIIQLWCLHLTFKVINSYPVAPVTDEESGIKKDCVLNLGWISSLGNLKGCAAAYLCVQVPWCRKL